MNITQTQNLIYIYKYMYTHVYILKLGFNASQFNIKSVNKVLIPIIITKHLRILFEVFQYQSEMHLIISVYLYLKFRLGMVIDVKFVLYLI